LTTSLGLGLIGVAFWHQDWQYSLPTQRPSDLEAPPLGASLRLEKLGLDVRDGRGVFLHFFNPDCPCSRFNVDHIRALVRSHRNDVRFIAVLQGESGSEKLRRSFDGLALGIESILDESGEIGRSVGVYATPQAVLISGEGTLYFRGNYNKARYCTTAETEYARIALESYLLGRPPADTSGPAYGCPLPRRSKGSASNV